MTDTKFGFTSSSLHIIAMILMLCDHLCMSVLGNQLWLHYVGRVAFPIFAFMIVEGYKHTHSVKKYLLRLLIAAVISEVPFDLICGGTAFFPTQQNVLWTFVVAILGMSIIDKTKNISRPLLKYLVFSVTSLLVLFVGFVIGTMTMIDYFGGGIVMVFVFYFFREDEILSFKIDYKKSIYSKLIRILNMLMQLYFVYTITVEMMGGLCTFINIFGKEVEVVVESFAVFAFIFIWFYNGQRGITDKRFKYFCYAFYPLHMALLVLLKMVLY